MKRMKLDWSLWGYALFNATVQGGATGVTSSTFISALAPEQFRLGSSKFFFMVCILFVTHGTVAFFNYLKQHGLPELITTTAMGSETVQRGGATTTTTFEQTKVEPAPQAAKE